MTTARQVRVCLRPGSRNDVGLHLGAIGLIGDPEGPITVRFDDSNGAVFDDDRSTLAWRLLARRIALARREAVTAVRVEVEAWRECGDVWMSGRVTTAQWAADGSATTSEDAAGPFGPEGDDCGWQEPAEAASWLVDTLRSTHFGALDEALPVERYRAVTHPDPWPDANPPTAAQTTWSGVPVDGPFAAYLAWRLGDRLDTSASAPDLSAWTDRLLRRHGTTAAPGFQADWERLTEAERARPSTDPRRVPAWKILAGDAILTAAEVATVVSELAPESAPVGHVVPGAWAETVAALRALTGAVVVRRVKQDVDRREPGR